MATVKTAVSLPEGLLVQVDQLAGELGVSRSKLFAFALSDMMDRHRKREILSRLNAVYGGEEDREELLVRERMAEYHKKIVEREG